MQGARGRALQQLCRCLARRGADAPGAGCPSASALGHRGYRSWNRCRASLAGAQADSMAVHTKLRTEKAWCCCSVSSYRQPGLTPDAALYGVIGCNVAGWLAWQNAPRFMSMHAVVSEPALRDLRLHTLLTACFSHQGAGHLFGNMCARSATHQRPGPCSGVADVHNPPQGSHSTSSGGAQPASLAPGGCGTCDGIPAPQSGADTPHPAVQFLALYCAGGITGNLAYVLLRRWQQRGSCEPRCCLLYTLCTGWLHQPAGEPASGLTREPCCADFKYDPGALGGSGSVNRQAWRAAAGAALPAWRG